MTGGRTGLGCCHGVDTAIGQILESRVNRALTLRECSRRPCSGKELSIDFGVSTARHHTLRPGVHPRSPRGVCSGWERERGRTPPVVRPNSMINQSYVHEGKRSRDVATVRRLRAKETRWGGPPLRLEPRGSGETRGNRNPTLANLESHRQTRASTGAGDGTAEPRQWRLAPQAIGQDSTETAPGSEPLDEPSTCRGRGAFTSVSVPHESSYASRSYAHSPAVVPLKMVASCRAPIAGGRECLPVRGFEESWTGALRSCRASARVRGVSRRRLNWRGCARGRQRDCSKWLGKGVANHVPCMWLWSWREVP